MRELRGVSQVVGFVQIGKKSNKELKLERVVDAYTQVVAGLNYRLVLEVSGGGPSHLEAVVYGRLSHPIPHPFLNL